LEIALGKLFAVISMKNDGKYSMAAVALSISRIWNAADYQTLRSLG